jgi:hypothetical protein
MKVKRINKIEQTRFVAEDASVVCYKEEGRERKRKGCNKEERRDKRKAKGKGVNEEEKGEKREKFVDTRRICPSSW